MSDLDSLALRVRNLRDLVGVLVQHAEGLERDIRITDALKNEGAAREAATLLSKLKAACNAADECATDIECAAAVAALPDDAPDADYHAVCERFTRRPALPMAAE